MSLITVVETLSDDSYARGTSNGKLFVNSVLCVGQSILGLSQEERGSARLPVPYLLLNVGCLVETIGCGFLLRRRSLAHKLLSSAAVVDQLRKNS